MNLAESARWRQCPQCQAMIELVSPPALCGAYASRARLEVSWLGNSCTSRPWDRADQATHVRRYLGGITSAKH